MPSFATQTNDVFLRDPVGSGWLLFRNPIHILAAERLEEVVPVLRQVDQAVTELGVYAAGFVAYEAAPGLDSALRTKPPGAFPLAWFGLYPEPESFPEIPVAPPTGSNQFSFSWKPSIDRQAYDAAIGRVREAIARGETYQVNYTFRLAADFCGDPLAFFAELARAQNAPYAAYIETGDYAVLSTSPELFFTLEGNRLASRPMKGTAPRGTTLVDDLGERDGLRASEKNQAENLMIVDMVRNDIGKIARIGSVRVPDLYTIEKYPTVWQMVSTVYGETEAGLCEIMQALFPPASITGAPKRRTMEIIADLETEPRRIYTGCIGFYGPQRRAQFNVAIRTVLIDKTGTGRGVGSGEVSGSAEYGVGGGITWDSVDAAEYEECRAKARILTRRMPTFSLLESLLWTPEEGFFLLDLHLKRLAGSAEYFSFPLDLTAVCEALIGLQDGLARQANKVRVLVDDRGRVTVQARPLPGREEKKLIRVCLAPAPVDSADPFLYHKTTHRQVYEQARQFCLEERGDSWDEVILWNEKGELTEGTTSNILVELDGELYTPPVSCGLLAGTYRAWLLAQGRIKERIIPVEALLKNPPIYPINSVRKQRPAQLILNHLPPQSSPSA